jgi:hypothetical protein
MDLPRKFGVGMVMLVPAFVLGGALWSATNSWIVVWILEALLAIGYGYGISGRRRAAKRA